MKTTYILGLGLFLLSTNSFAEKSVREMRTERIMNDSVLVASVKAVESKYSMKCVMQEINQWRCLNGSACGYSMEVICKSEQTGEGLGQELRLMVDGFDTGSTNHLDRIEFRRGR